MNKAAFKFEMINNEVWVRRNKDKELLTIQPTIKDAKEWVRKRINNYNKSKSSSIKYLNINKFNKCIKFLK